MKKSKGLVATEIQRLAQANGVSAERDGLSRMALTITVPGRRLGISR